MQNYALWWPVVGGVTFLAVLILAVILTGGQSPSSKAKLKRKKTKKRWHSRSPHDTTGHTVKKHINVFKRCGRCRRKITVTDTHDLCLECLGKEHPMLDCELCMAFTWKTFRARFLRQFLWVSAARERPELKDQLGPPSSSVSSSIIAKTIAKVEGYLQYQELMSDPAKCFKTFDTQASAPLDVSSPLSAQEESAGSSVEGEGGQANSSSHIEESCSQRKSVQTTAQTHENNVNCF